MRLNQQRKIFIILCLTTLFNFTLVGYRNHLIDFNYAGIQSISDLSELGVPTFMFLIWNLFLAWIPYSIAISIKWLDDKNAPKFILGLALATWLVFFPNAPYIITDLLHLSHRPPVPKWYDLLMLFSFAWTGLMLAYASMMQVQIFLKKHSSGLIAWSLCISVLILSGFGIFIGRFQRWNSWDIITQPGALFADILNIISHPIANLDTLGMAVILAAMLVLGYLSLIILSLPNERLEAQMKQRIKAG